MISKLFMKRMEVLLGSEFNDFHNEIEKEPVRSLKVNTLKADCTVLEPCEDFSLERIEYLDNGYIFSKEKIGNHPLHQAGAFYIQDPSAMSTVAAASEFVKPGMKVLDMCSAPGGKSVQLAGLTKGRGLLVSNEYNRDRCRILRSNLERIGSKNTVITNCDTEVFKKECPNFFDFILCDVPCSGEGMFRKYNEEVYENWSEENVALCAERQKYILNNAYGALDFGGYLLYSTCTFSTDENEDNINWFLNEYPDMSIVSVDNRIKAVTRDGINKPEYSHDMTDCRRFYPHITKGEGQFICLMKKDGIPLENTGIKYSGLDKLTKDEEKITLDFLNEVGIEVKLAKLHDYIMILPEYIYSNKNTMCAGVCAGQVIKNRFDPHHNLFTAYGKEFKNKVNLRSTEKDTFSYLAGETIKVEGPNGWCSVLIDGCPVGGGKIVNGVMKNHYPKGLRVKM